MIEVHEVSKYFQDIEALNGVSITVPRGSIYGLVGSNGAGKTTLLKILAAIYRADTGRVTIDGQAVFENIDVKARTLFVPDFLYYYPNFTIQDMALFYSRIYPAWDEERYSKLGSLFDIDVKRRMNTLSKGMQRQVACWLGISLKPEVMLLDEPLDGLDPLMRQNVKNLIIQDVAQRSMTVVISSHNLRDLEDICDHIGIMHRGSMLIQKELDDLKADIHKIQVAFAGGIPESFLDEVPALYREQRGSVLIFITRGGRADIMRRIQDYQPAILDILPLTLEEIFIYEMGDKGYEIQNILY